MYAKTTWVDGAGGTTMSAANLNKMQTQSTLSVVIGQIKIWCGTTAPSDFLLCDGSTYDGVSPSVYRNLMLVSSYYFGGAGSSFAVPDLRGKYLAGLGSGDYSTMGKTGGSSEVTLTIATMPAHTHTIPYSTLAGVTHDYYVNSNAVALSNQLDSAGSGGAHENRPQSLVLNYIVRYR